MQKFPQFGDYSRRRRQCRHTLVHGSMAVKFRGDILREYIDKYVYSWSDHTEYLKLIGSELPVLEDDPTKILSDPFKEWVYPADKVRQLLAEAGRRMV